MSLGGASVVVGKFILHLPIFFAQTICLFFALVFIVPLALIKEGRPKLSRIIKRDYIFMLLQGFSGVLMFRVFMMLALRYASAASTGIVLSTTPAVLALFSVIFLKEKMGFRTLLAVILCFAGMSFLNVDFNHLSLKMSMAIFLGNLFAFFSVCSESAFTIFRKKQSYSDKPLTSTAIVMFFAFILFLPIGIYQFAAGGAQIALCGKDFVFMFIYGAACSSIAYALWFSGLAKVKIHEAAGFSGFMPLSSVLLSVLLLKEKITAGHLLGMALVLIGIYIIVLKKDKAASKIIKDNNLAN
jgi:drug/metabolite transporter (DMT)-like permease